MGAGCCDSKPFGKPCGDCAFDTPRASIDTSMPSQGHVESTDEATDSAAIGWGMKLAQSESGLSDLWKSLLALDVAGRVENSESMSQWLAESSRLVSEHSVALGSRYSDSIAQLNLDDSDGPPDSDERWPEYGGGVLIGDEPGGGVGFGDAAESPYSADGPVDSSGLSKEEIERQKKEIKKLKKDFPFITDPSGKGGGGDGGGGSGLTSGKDKKPGEFEDLHPKGGKGGKGCCVKKFGYPSDKDPAKLDEGAVTYKGYPSRIVKFLFKTDISYWPTSKQRPTCACSCCTFRQFVIRDQVDYSATLGDDPKEGKVRRDGKLRWKKGFFSEEGYTGKKGEDCVWFLWDASLGIHVRRQGDKNRWYGDHPSNWQSGADRRQRELLSPDQGPYCYGLKKPPAHVLGPGGKPGRAGPTHTITECRFTATDEPQQAVRLNRKFAWQITFLGVVYDTCNGWAIRRVKKLHTAVAGYSGTADPGTGRIWP